MLSYFEQAPIQSRTSPHPPAKARHDFFLLFILHPHLSRAAPRGRALHFPFPISLQLKLAPPSHSLPVCANADIFQRPQTRPMPQTSPHLSAHQSFALSFEQAFCFSDFHPVHSKFSATHFPSIACSRITIMHFYEFLFTFMHFYSLL